MTNTYPPVNWTKLAAWQLEEARTFERGGPTWRLFIEGALNVIAKHSRKVSVRDDALILLAAMRKRYAKPVVRGVPISDANWVRLDWYDYDRDEKAAASKITLPTDNPLPEARKFDWKGMDGDYVAGESKRVMTMIDLTQPKPIPPMKPSLREVLEKFTREAFFGKPSDV